MLWRKIEQEREIGSAGNISDVCVSACTDAQIQIQWLGAHGSLEQTPEDVTESELGGYGGRAFRQREEQANSSVRGAGGAQGVELPTRVEGHR